MNVHTLAVPTRSTASRISWAPRVEPVECGVGVVRRLAVAHVARVEGVAAPVGDDLCGPTVSAADVAEQMLQRPVGTGGNRRVGIAGRDQGAEGVGLLEQCGPEIHVTNLAPHAPCRA